MFLTCGTTHMWYDLAILTVGESRQHEAVRVFKQCACADQCHDNVSPSRGAHFTDDMMLNLFLLGNFYVK